ncbi:radical SAM protein [Pyrofollis japonicus]|uniref:radical SAM protein n=1 Tax=Pyrofollis japonicus TaxID=3060460 RepID=UPI00295BBC0A|nr:radical SAM protein [Pyrofollis japonicus]
MPRFDIVFGPVYSRRLGLSLGINNIPYKYCSYTCIYCQLGRTIRLTIERKPFSNPNEIVRAVAEKLAGLDKPVDYVTFVPGGEPTLDTMLGRDIEALKKELGVRVAVLSNASLLWIKEVREDLASADTVSVKVDAGDEAVWKRVDRPHPSLSFNKVVEGILEFRDEYGGRLITETMLVKDVNDSIEELRKIAVLIEEIRPATAYIMVPVRPPAEPWVRPASAEALVALYRMLEERGIGAEILGRPEPPPPPPHEDPLRFVAATVAVHPLRLSYVQRIFEEKGLSIEAALKELINKYGVEVVSYGGEKFLVRRPRAEIAKK